MSATEPGAADLKANNAFRRRGRNFRNEEDDMRTIATAVLAGAALLSGCGQSGRHYDPYDYGNYEGDWSPADGRESSLTLDTDQWEWSGSELFNGEEKGSVDCVDAFVSWRPPGSAELVCVKPEGFSFHDREEIDIAGRDRLLINRRIWVKD